MALLAALGAFHLAFLIVQTKTPSINTTLSLASGILTFIAVLAASLHSILEDQRSTRPSDLLILYFSASTILALPRLRTLWLIPSASTAKALWTAIFILTALVVPLESIGKKKFLQTTYQSLTKEEETGFWGRSFFTWLLPFFRLGYSRVIHVHDMPEVDADLTGETAVTFMQTPKTPQSEKYGQALVGAYVLTYIGLAVSRAAYSRQQYRFTTMIRAGLIDIIFRKTVSLKADDLKDSAAVTLMGTDVERIVTTFAMFHEIWASVFEVGIAVFLLQQQIQIASIVPVVISIVCVVGVIPISKTIGRAQTVWIERLQKRVAVTATMIGDMKAIKMLGLREVLSGVILQLRRVELSGSEKFRKLLLWQVLVSNLPNEFAPFATFVIYSIIALITKDQTLTSTNAFTALSLINLLTDPLLRFCQTVGWISTRLFGQDGHFRQNGISVILATHTRHLLRFADEVVVVENGQILSQDPYEKVLATSTDVVTTSAPADDSADSISEQDTVPSPNVEKEGQVVVTDNNEADRLRQNGSWLVYKYYFEQGGWVAFGLFVASTITESFCAGFTTIWFQWWVEANGEEPNQDLGMYLGVYALLFLTNMFALILECWVMFIRIINNTATGLHADLLQTSLKAPLSFFQSTDTGSITNRFSQDLNLVDMTLPSNAINFFTNSCACVIKLIILCVLGKYLASSIPLLVAVLFFVQRYYLRTSRQVRLLDIEAKAPMYTHFLETLKGVGTIRAYGWEKNFEAQASALLNRSQKPHYMLACIQQWLALVLDLVVGALALIVVAMATSLTDKFTPGAVGVAMVLVLGFNSDLAVTIKNWTALETSIGAVSRIREFANETPSEERELGSNGAPPAGWPLKGAIKFENVTARYTADAAATLKSLSLDISPGQRIAVTDGRIFIDGTDLSTLERSAVRSDVNVIPQEPFFMPGTVRFNLDPHSRASSSEIKTALDKVGLLSRIGMAGGLDAELEADGFSVGERQLLALARAIISKSQILVLDEATSSVDQETESMMQSIIDREFSEQTVISVIHRLRFVENYDKVLLLSRGEILEWDTPRSLLMRDSEFQKFFTSTQSSQ
ncbi:ABC transporter atnG [Colletotrichum sp. SAR11_240]|nr:ABC transporter atnG [Colletotrichum sp. SAR11_240]